MGLFGKKEVSPSKSENLYLENHVKAMELNQIKLETQFNQVHQLAEGYRSDARKNMGELQRVAETICDNDYSKEQLGGKNRILSLSSFELANFIINNWKKQREEAIDLIIGFQKALREKEGQVKDLEAQLERVLQQQRDLAHMNQQYVAPTIIETPSGQIDSETGEILAPPVPTPPIPEKTPQNNLKSGEADDILKVLEQQSSPQPQEEISTYEDPKTHLVLMEEIENKMTEMQWGIIQVIGKDGFSEPKEIEEILLERIKGSNHTQFVNGLNGLKTNLIVGEDKVNTGWRWFNALHLTDLGLQLYQKKFRIPAVLCEKHVLRKENATWDHGYCIKDTSTLMEQMGYQNITYARKDNEIKLSNGKVWIPDITAYDTIANKKVYVEVELGHHTQKEFNEKMDKARQITNDLRFVTNSKTAMETIIQQFSKWKLEKAKTGAPVKNFNVWITTTKKLSDKDWGNEYPS